MGQLILNVDDFEPQRYARSRILRGAGFEVVEAGSGARALDLARQHHPALVVLDVQLPDIDGREVCRQLKADAQTAHILVLHVSATFRDPVTRAAALNDGADAYLAETLEPDELVAQVRALLRLAAAEAEARRAQEEARASEERLRLAQRAGGIGVYDWNPETGAAIWTPELERIYGLAAPANPIERQEAWRRLVHPEDREAIWERAGEWLASGPPELDWEYRIVRPDGETRWVSGRSVLFRDEAGRPKRVIGTNVDITDRKRAEDALNRANAELAEADRRKDEFLAVLSHELRNPLAPIRFAVPALQAQPLDDAGRRAVAVVQRQVDHLTRLVDDLLDVSRIVNGKIELRREHVSLGSIVSAAAEAASPRIAAGRHTLVLDVADEPIWVLGDPARLAQVVTNLLDNAAKYTPPGGEVRLEARAEKGRAIVRVRDTGIGIPPECLPDLFDMFRQVSRPGGELRGGLGIGLALVKSLVQMHGGSVAAHSAGEGKGAEFLVWLPIVDETRSAAVAPGGDTASSVRRARVLVVDDNADLVEMLAMVVTGAGHDVRKAHDGRSAIAAALSYRPDVVLLDLGLPGMSGIDVAMELRRQPELSGMRLVALTGWGQPEDRRRTEEAGFDYHLTKPTDPQELQRLLDRLAARP